MFSVHLMGAQIQTLAHCEVQMRQTNKQTGKGQAGLPEDNHKLKKAFSSSFKHAHTI